MPIIEHEAGGFRDRCGKCGGWISMGHAIGSECRPAGYYCQTCCGDGWVSADLMPPGEPCPDCKGTGRTSKIYD
jgi:hypothetical protein